jgi:dihydropteroate synthase
MIINDISGGCEAMYALVREKKVPYIWTLRGDLTLPARQSGMSDIELILDPGFGFTGSTEADYTCMRALDGLRAYGREILIGVSRKSMVYKPLGLTPESCLIPTQALQLYAIEHGATIIRTHDVAATQETVQLCELLQMNKS